MSQLPNVAALLAKVNEGHPGGLISEVEVRLNAGDSLSDAAPDLAACLIECEKALRGLLEDDDLPYPPDGDTCFCSMCKAVRFARSALARLVAFDASLKETTE